MLGLRTLLGSPSHRNIASNLHSSVLTICQDKADGEIWPDLLRIAQESVFRSSFCVTLIFCLWQDENHRGLASLGIAAIGNSPVSAFTIVDSAIFGGLQILQNSHAGVKVEKAIRSNYFQHEPHAPDVKPASFYPASCGADHVSLMDATKPMRHADATTNSLRNIEVAEDTARYAEEESMAHEDDDDDKDYGSRKKRKVNLTHVCPFKNDVVLAIFTSPCLKPFLISGAHNAILLGGFICFEKQILCLEGTSLPGILITQDIFTYVVIYLNKFQLLSVSRVQCSFSALLCNSQMYLGAYEWELSLHDKKQSTYSRTLSFTVVATFSVSHFPWMVSLSGVNIKTLFFTATQAEDSRERGPRFWRVACKSESCKATRDSLPLQAGSNPSLHRRRLAWWLL